MDDKPTFKRRGQGHVTHFIFWGTSDISVTANVKVAKFCVLVEYIQC